MTEYITEWYWDEMRNAPNQDQREERQMSELLPCPFCGGEASIEKCWNFDDESPSGYFVWCHGNDCVVEPMTEDFKEEAEAIAAWNSRAERTCEFISSKGSDYPPVCSECGYELGIYDCEWFEDGTYGYGGNYCPNCGAKVVS